MSSAYAHSCFAWLPIARQAERQGGLLRMLTEALVPGITVGCMVVPQGIAYAVLAGLPPAYGLYSSTFALFVYALFGCSPQLAVGPVALVALLTKNVIDVQLGADATEEDAIQLAVTLTFLVGVFQLAFGVLRVGGIVNFVSHDVLVGFTSGAGVIIAVSQCKYLLGISVGRHHYPWQTVIEILSEVPRTNLVELLLSCTSLVLLIGMKTWRKRHPPAKAGDPPHSLAVRAMQLVTQMSALVNILIFTPVTYFLVSAGYTIKIVGDQPTGLPPLTTPDMQLALGSSAVLTSALIIAVVAFLEAFAVAHAVATPPSEEDSRGGAAELDANKELIALGLANITGTFFSHFPVAGGFGRTAVQAKAGAKSQLSGAVTGLFVVLALLFVMPLFHYLPYCVLAAIIEVAVAGIIEYSAMKEAWRASRRDFAVSMSTFVVVLGLGVEAGLAAGVGISISLLLIRSSQPHMAELGRMSNLPSDVAAATPSKSMDSQVQYTSGWERGSWCSLAIASAASRVPGCIVLRIDGAIIFTSTATIMDNVTTLVDEYGVGSGSDTCSKQVVGAESIQLKSFVLDMGQVHDLDLSGMHMLQSLDTILTRRGVTLMLAQPTEPVREALSRMLQLHHHGPTVGLSERTFGTIDGAVESSYPVVAV
jgi:SulP family sulfate permease